MLHYKGGVFLKRFIVFMLVILLLLCSCTPNTEKIPEKFAVEEIPENSQSSESFENFSQHEQSPKASQKTNYYSARGPVTEAYGALPGRFQWNNDGTLTFQNKNTLYTLSADNKIIEEIPYRKMTFRSSPANLYGTISI